ncbi:MAG TPA: DUF1428 domain-containing protein [Phycisphaerales bacterium]|nr:DUF1428 domain-containing protein [Phycisphaerales bacterium]
MGKYVDGFVLPLAEKNVAAYRKMSKAASKVFMEHGALEYIEAVGEDLKIKGMRAFGPAAGARAGETVVFSYIVYRSRKHRDTVNKKVMTDPRLAKLCGPGAKVPFDVKRMCYGGFSVMVTG